MVREKRKPNIVVVVIVIALFVILNVPFNEVGFRDGGSTGYMPLIPWYCYVEYHQLPDRVAPHNTEGEFGNEALRFQYPSYVSGHGVYLFGMEIVFDKYEVYPDGHRVKISGFAVEF